MIAIMGAMREEIEPLLEQISEIKAHIIGPNTYYTGRYADRDVVIAYSRIGKVNAAVTATVMLAHFGASRLLFSGVAGAISGDLKVGDLVAATQLVQHDVDLTSFGHPIAFLPETGDYFSADAALLQSAQAVADSLDLQLKTGTIATGDQFIADTKKKQWIHDTFKADAVEMEGASVAAVCAGFGVPFFVLRAISDAADMEANFSFDAFLESSAKVSAAFVLEMIKRLP
jgi:adenosylhomocysteine/aminodeoxyfutalosine nucleosidase